MSADADLRSSHRWGVILAGTPSPDPENYGRRQAQAILRSDRSGNLLKQTRRRIDPLIPKSQTLQILTRTDERYYADEVIDVPAPCLLIQPHNHGTAQRLPMALRASARWTR